jgi:hypothetical protein
MLFAHMKWHLACLDREPARTKTSTLRKTFLYLETKIASGDFFNRILRSDTPNVKVQEHQTPCEAGHKSPILDLLTSQQLTGAPSFTCVGRPIQVNRTARVSKR